MAISGVKIDDDTQKMPIRINLVSAWFWFKIYNDCTTASFLDVSFIYGLEIWERQLKAKNKHFFNS